MVMEVCQPGSDYWREPMPGMIAYMHSQVVRSYNKNIRDNGNQLCLRIFKGMKPCLKSVFLRL